MRLSKHLLHALILGTLATPPLHAEHRLRIEPMTFTPASGEAVAAELGTLVVSESRRAVSTHPIELRFVRFRSTSKHPGPPIVYLAGGPGGSGIDAAKGARLPLFLALRKFGDVIALDQRGTGASAPSMRCTEPYLIPLTKPLDRAEAEGIFAAAMKKCFARLSASGTSPAAYNTLESADDLDDLRQALGAEKITLWGISYGTHLALAMLRAHGDRVERAILAGVEPLESTLKLPRDQEALLLAIARLASDDPEVGKALPDLRAAIARALERLQKEAATVTLAHPATGQAVAVAVGALDLQLVLAGMLTGPETFAGMADFVTRLEGGDWTALALQAGRFRMGELPSAMSVAMDCASGAGREHLARIAAETGQTLLGDVINLPFPGICTGLGIPDLGDGYRAPVRSELPILLISGTLDGRTPPSNAEAVMQGFPNAEHLVVEGAGHGDALFLSSPEILAAMESFLSGQKLRRSRITVQPAPLIAPRRVVALGEEVLARYTGTYQIEGEEARKVVKAGSTLFTIRGDGAPFPLRPTSTTEFFWEGMPARVRFEISPEGEVRGMTVDPDGSGHWQKTSPKID